MTKKIYRYIDFRYLSRFFLILLPLYFFHIFYNGVISPGGSFYSAFLEHHLNYIDWISTSILSGARFIDQLSGLPAHITIVYTAKGFVYTIRSEQASVLLWLPCLGLGIMSFWIAFITAHAGNWKIKSAWCVAGILIIWVINCCRIAILLLALQNKWKAGTFFNHHDMFNLAAYSFIISGMVLYVRKNRNVKQLSISN